MSLADELRKITERVTSSHEAEETKSRQALLDEWGLPESETNLKRIDEELRFRRAVSQIPSRARLAAELGEREVTVYRFREDEIDRSLTVQLGSRDDGCTSDMLTGAAERLYQHCVAEHLSPRIEFWRNQLRRSYGWQIVIRW